MISKRTLNRITGIVMVLLFLPAGAVQASKDSAPGDSMYPVKLTLEKAILLAMKPSNSATSDMEMKFTKRRLIEVEQVADTAFVVDSLDNLSEQVGDATDSISKVKDSVKQSELTKEYIQTLRQTQASLEQQKYAVANKAGNGYSYPPSQQIINNYYYQNQPQQNNNYVPTTNNGGNTAPTNNYVPSTNNSGGNTAAPNNNVPAQQPNQVFPQENNNNQEQQAPPPQEVQQKIEETQSDIEEKIKILEAVQARNELEKQQKEDLKEERKEAVEEWKENNKGNGKGNDKHDD